MASFSVTVTSEAVVQASRQAVWEKLTDPQVLVKLTPLLEKIEDHGETWVWHMSTVGGLGKSLRPVFTETMKFDEERSIDFHHTPPKGSHERIGVEGHYDISDTKDGVCLKVSLTIDADLPLPKAASPAVTRVMRRTATTMGDRFSANFLKEVGAR